MKKTIRRNLSFVLCAAILFGLFASNALAMSRTSGKCGKNVSWSYDAGSNTLTISGKGAMYHYNSDKPTPWTDCIDDDYEPSVTIIVKKGVTSLGDGVFQDINIKKISLPNTLKKIGAQSITSGLDTGYDMAPSITIPKSVTSIGKWALIGGAGLKTIKVEQGNKKFVSVDGVLFNKSKTTLIACPTYKKGNFSIPSKTTVLDDYSFYGSRLKKLTVPQSVKIINLCSLEWARIKNVYFKGKPPKGLEDSLWECEIGTIHYPSKYSAQWKQFIASLDSDGDGSNIKWKQWKG